jgi:hypothetical protein
MARPESSLRTHGLDRLSMQEASTLALCGALLDFAAAPGRHALRLREPAVLFDELDLVALWALGRLPEGVAQPQAVRQAALLFVLRACFAPGLNHYQLLGLSRSFHAAQLRARYRALIRLTHPDMGIEGLPVGAAGMVNRAHAVLADEAQRALYDRQLFAQLPSAAAMPSATGLDAGRVGAASPGLSNLALVGSRWSFLRHVVSMRVLRMVLTGGVLLLGAVLALGWAMRESGTNSRLVANERGVSAVKPGAAETESVSLRIPTQWANGIDVPVSGVLVPTPSTKDLTLPPQALAAHTSLAPRAVASAASVPGTRASAASPAVASVSTSAQAPSVPSVPVEPVAPPSTSSFLAALASAFKSAPPKIAEPAPAATSAGLGATSSGAASSGAAAQPVAVPAASSAASSGAAIRSESAAQASVSPPSPAAPAPAAPAPAAPAPAAKVAAAGPSVGPPPGPKGPPVGKVDAAPAALQSSADAPSVAGRGTVWDVDVPSARTYLQDLLNQLAQPEQARSTSHALTQMNVNGSLLMPPGAVGDVVRSVQIERADLSESHRPGFLRIRGVMKAQVSSPNTQPRAVRWRVQAEFRGTAQGTVLTLLDLRETE